jgi:hypothetical protein
MDTKIVTFDKDETRMLGMCAALTKHEIGIEERWLDGRVFYEARSGDACGELRRSKWMALKSLWRKLGGVPSSDGLELLRGGRAPSSEEE